MQFTIYGKPKGKDRPRFGQGRTYTAPATKEYEDRVKFEYARQCRNRRFEGNVKVDIVAYTEPQKALPKKKREELIGQYYPSKPDCDNIEKIVLDALNGVAYEDDKQVVSLTCQKFYAEQSRVVVDINEVEENKNERRGWTVRNEDIQKSVGDARKLLCENWRCKVSKDGGAEI